MPVTRRQGRPPGTGSPDSKLILKSIRFHRDELRDVGTLSKAIRQAPATIIRTYAMLGIRRHLQQLAKEGKP